MCDISDPEWQVNYEIAVLNTTICNTECVIKDEINYTANCSNNINKYYYSLLEDYYSINISFFEHYTSQISNDTIKNHSKNNKQGSAIGEAFIILIIVFGGFMVVMVLIGKIAYRKRKNFVNGKVYVPDIDEDDDIDEIDAEN